MQATIRKISEALAKYRLTFSNEGELQGQLAQIFTLNGIEFDREFNLSKADRPDFFLPQPKVAIEVKVAGSIEKHLRQMKRYNEHDAVAGTILIGTRPYDLPATLSAKPVALINIGGQRL